MNLRDQLVKAGLRSKKDAKKAANKLKVEKKKKKKAEKKGETFTTEAEKIKADIEAKKAQQLEKDKQLNQKISKDRELKEKKMRALEIIYSNEVYELRPENRYYFVEEKKIVRKVMATDLQVTQLSKGLLGIAKDDFESESFRLLSGEDCLRVMDLFPELIVCLHLDEKKDAV